MDTMQKIAVLTDSCSDVPRALRKSWGYASLLCISTIAMRRIAIVVDIQPDEVYARFAEEIPKTSTPSPSDVAEAFDEFVGSGRDACCCRVHLVRAFRNARLVQKRCHGVSESPC